MASREDKIASGRKKLKKFQQRGAGPKGKVSQHNMSAPSGDQMSLNEGGYVDALNRTAPLQDNGALSRSSATENKMLDSDRAQQYGTVNGHVAMATISGSDGHNISPVAMANGRGVQPTTPTRSSSFTPSSTSTPHHHHSAQSRIAPQHLDASQASVGTGVSPTHFGFRPAPADPTSGGGAVNGLPSRTVGVPTRMSSSSLPSAHAAVRQQVAELPSASQQTHSDAGEIENMRKQLTSHQQTIDLLVDEKNSLQTTCSKYDDVIRERDGSILNYTLQLKAVSEQCGVLQSQVAQREAALQQSKARRSDGEFDALQTELQRTQADLQESRQLMAELSRKVQAHAADSTQLRQERDSLAEKLRTTSTLLQQTSSEGSIDELRRSHEAAAAEKSRLEKQLTGMSTSLQRTVTERDMAVVQCQQAVEQANNIKQHLDQERARLSEQHAQFRQAFEQQAAQITELQQQLALSQQGGESTSSEKLLGMQRSLQALALEKQSLTESFTAESAKAHDLQRLSGEQAERIRQLEVQVSRASESNTDRQQMLGSIQADKAAISQATLANRELRQRMEQMEQLQAQAAEEQEKLEARLSADRDETKLLEERLEQKTGLLRQVQEDLATSKEEVASLHSENDDLSDQLAKHVQISNRRQHLEAQGQLSDALQQELTAAQEALQRLHMEKDQLHQTVLQQQALLNAARDKDLDDVDLNGSRSSVGSSRAESPNQEAGVLSARIKLLDGERSRLETHLQELRQRYNADVASLQQEVQHLKLQTRLAERDAVDVDMLVETGSTATHAQSLAVPRHVHDGVQKTLEELQDRFLTVMMEKAELVQKVQSLEHTTGQLEGETNTIGEYISLYQKQRDVLRKRYEKKDEYIEQLVEEQANMESKVEELRGLVTDLVAERKNLITRFMQSGLVGTPSEHSVVSATASGTGGTGVFGDESLSDDADNAAISALQSPADLSQVNLSDAATPLPAVMAANDTHRAEKILALLSDLTPSHLTVSSVSEEITGANGAAPRVGVDMEFLPCSCCEGRLLRV